MCVCTIQKYISFVKCLTTKSYVLKQLVINLILNLIQKIDLFQIWYLKLYFLTILSFVNYVS